MATKTANVLARVEPEVKADAEKIMADLGVPVSVVINMLYKQIILQRKIPFEVSLPESPVARYEMTKEVFDRMMLEGLRQAQENEAEDAKCALEDIKKDILG